MKILSLILTIAILSTIFLIIADTKITFFPFSFKMTHFIKAVGWFMLGVGFFCIIKDAEDDGYKRGSDATIKILTEKLEQYIVKDTVE